MIVGTGLDIMWDRVRAIRNVGGSFSLTISG